MMGGTQQPAPAAPWTPRNLVSFDDAQAHAQTGQPLQGSIAPPPGSYAATGILPTQQPGAAQPTMQPLIQPAANPVARGAGAPPMAGGAPQTPATAGAAAPAGGASTGQYGFQLPQNVQSLLSTLNSGKAPGGPVQTSLNTSNVPALTPGADLSKMMQQQQQAAYSNATGYLDPQWDNAGKALQSQLVNQGIPQNSEAWNKAMDDFGRNKQFAYQQAQSNAVTQGNAAQAQMFGQGLAANQNQFGQNLGAGQFANSAQNQTAQQLLQQMGYNTQLGTASIGAQTANNQLNELASQNNFNNSLASRNQGINEMLLDQQNPLNMYNSLMGGNNVTPPNFTQTPGANVGGTDIASIIQQAMTQGNNVYNTQVGAQNSNNAGYAEIISALLSDRRLKTNVKFVGMHDVGVPLYSFDYLWGEPGMGVMADELERVRPDAVFTIDGLKVVDYARI